MKHIKEIKLNESNISDIEFDKARKNMKELSEYLEMDEKRLMEIIYFGWEENWKPTSEEKMTSLAYSYGLI